jgi:hypothetical protein
MPYSGISVDGVIAVSRLGEDAKLEAFFDTGTVPGMYIPLLSSNYSGWFTKLKA